MATCTLLCSSWNPRTEAFSPRHLCHAVHHTSSFTTEIHVSRSLHNQSNNRGNSDCTNEPSSGILTDDELRDRLRQAYEFGETDGILDLASTTKLADDYDLDNLFVTFMEAASYNKGKAAGIINGWIGSCCLMNDREQGATLAWKLLRAYDDNEMGINPDIVTFSLVYSALVRTDQEEFHVLANIVMERAEQLSKKEGGSKRRRALAASNRKILNPNNVDLSPFGIKVLHETPHLMVLSKPSGMVCFHKKSTTAGKLTKSRIKNQTGSQGDEARIDVSLQDALLHAGIPLSTLNAECRGLVHRIDRGTSGCIVLAKTNDMHAKLVTEFFLRKAKKSYQALVKVRDEKQIPEEGEISVSIGGRPAKSTYVMEERINNYARLRLNTLTGRKHQVRIHCAQGLDAPILLDLLYGDDKLVCPKPIMNLSQDGQRFFLHASSLHLMEFGIDCEAALPSWWQDAMDILRKE